MIIKIESAFKEIMEDHKGIYDKALEFYTQQAKKKINSLQLQFEQQTSILSEMENISANMSAGLQSSIL